MSLALLWGWFLFREEAVLNLMWQFAGNQEAVKSSKGLTMSPPKFGW